MFTDGSLLDGQWAGCAALGWTFVALDDNDCVVAAAHGVPPRWVDSIQGAELWAVHVALETMLFPEALYTDCLTVQKGVQKDADWAGSARRRYARIWMALHTALDGGRDAHRIAWMPAHTKTNQVGSAVCSHGQVLTEAMRSANELADLLAKTAAEGVSIGNSFRDHLQTNCSLAKDIAIFVGRLTHEAGAHEQASGGCARDSTGHACNSLRRGRQAVARIVEPQPSLYERSTKLAGIRERIRCKEVGARQEC